MTTPSSLLPASVAKPRHGFRWTPGFVIGLVLLAVIFVLAIIGPPVWGEQADVLADRAAQPSAEHPLGTDAAGHDMLARTLAATRLTVAMTLGAAVIAIVGGVLVGTGVWLLSRRPRELLLRVIDGMVAFPGMLLALVVAAVLGAGAGSVVIAIGVSGIPYFARLTANLAASLSHREFIQMAQLFGVPRRRILRAHLLPNMAEPILVLAASNFAQSLTAISALSFVGLGVQSPDYDWGRLLSDALPSLLAGRPAQSLGPALLIVITGVGAVLLGDGLAAAADPRISTRARRSGAKSRLPRESAPATPSPQHGDAQPLLDVRGLTVTSATGRVLVDEVSLHVHRGEIVGIVGESGSGKSLTAMTIAQLIPDELEVSAERVHLAGADLLSPVDPATMVKSVGVVFQDPGTTFNPSLKLGTQLTEVPRRHGGLTRAAATERVIDALSTVHLTAPELRMRQYPHELSGGMRQRAMIASVLVNRPELIIADEPTTALDVTVQAEILREMKRINSVHHTSMLVISHDIAVVRVLCDRVVVMKDGRIVERLRSSELTLEHAQHPYTRRLLAASPSLHDTFSDATGVSA